VEGLEAPASDVILTNETIVNILTSMTTVSRRVRHTTVDRRVPRTYRLSPVRRCYRIPSGPREDCPSSALPQRKSNVKALVTRIRRRLTDLYSAA
jgi:hypothetical protein